MEKKMIRICCQNTGYGWWSSGEVAETLRTPVGGDSTKANLVVEMIVMQRRFSNVIVQDTEISPTIEAGGGEGGNNLPMIVSYGFIPKNSGKTRGIGYEEEVFPTLGTGSGCGGGRSNSQTG